MPSLKGPLPIGYFVLTCYWKPFLHSWSCEFLVFIVMNFLFILIKTSGLLFIWSSGQCPLSFRTSLCLTTTSLWTGFGFQGYKSPSSYTHSSYSKGEGWINWALQGISYNFSLSVLESVETWDLWLPYHKKWKIAFSFWWTLLI